MRPFLVCACRRMRMLMVTEIDHRLVSGAAAAIRCNPKCIIHMEKKI